MLYIFVLFFAENTEEGISPQVHKNIFVSLIIFMGSRPPLAGPRYAAGHNCGHSNPSSSKKICPQTLRVCGLFFAEEEGFEPPDRFQSPVFKTGAIGHSAIPPLNSIALF